MIKTNNSPEKIYVELTTRCNLHYQMCVKYMAGSCIAETDMDVAVFRHLLPSLLHAKTAILNGIGESLLHPNLVEIIRLAREQMAKEAGEYEYSPYWSCSRDHAQLL